MDLNDIDFNLFITQQEFSNHKEYLEWIIYKYEKNYKEKLSFETLFNLLTILLDIDELKYTTTELINEFLSSINNKFLSKILPSYLLTKN